ncbi:MAG: hypothetical protein QNJ14_08740 [Woeseiaceae bacterium]|nr:hypothetical protein [Woeseiaceae bacterium]
MGTRPSKEWALYLCLVAIASCASPQREADEVRAIVIPMEIVNRTPVVVVKVGEEEVPLQLDLGSGTTLTLFPQVFDRIDAQPTGEVHMSMGIEGVAMENPVFTVPLAMLGEAVFEDLEVRRDDHSEQHRAETIAYRGTYGRVGRGLFDEGKLVVDYQNELLTILPTNAAVEDQRACSGVEIPLEIDKESLGLTTKVNTDIGELYAVWDTGARGNIMLKKTTDAAGLSLEARDTFQTETFAMNGHDFGPVRMNVWDIPVLPPDLHTLLGYWFFADKIVCVDFPGKRLLIRTATKPPQAGR